MKHLKHIFVAPLLALILVGCDKAPNGVIPESKMVDFLIDMHKVDAAIEMRQEDYPTDSAKRAVKQALFKKHGITQELYDSSMVWYAHNIETYEKVYKKVIISLQDELKETSKRNFSSASTQEGYGTPSRKIYPATGDTADIWTGDRLIMLTPGMKQGYYTFDYSPTRESSQGDRYQLIAKLLSFSNTFTLLLGVEYDDGTMSIVNKKVSYTGWSELPLLTDYSRRVRRIYGYIAYDLQNQAVAFIDSVQLLRTRFNEKEYPAIYMQKFISSNKNDSIPKLH